MSESQPSRILITGCGRSGTRYTVALLRMHGLDVRHERLGRHGTASWCMAVDSERTPWGPARRQSDFEIVFHQVRAPLQAIQSMVSLKDASWRYICEWIPCDLREPPLVRSAKYWYYWNIHAEKIADWRYRIEEFPLVYTEFCTRLGLVPDETLFSVLPKDINTRSRGWLLHAYDELCMRANRCPSEPIRRRLSRRRAACRTRALTWDDLGLDSSMTRRIRDKAVEYGYAY